MDFVEICKVYVGKMIIKAAKRIFNSDKICRSYSDLYFGVTFGTPCTYPGSALANYDALSCNKWLKWYTLARMTGGALFLIAAFLGVMMMMMMINRGSQAKSEARGRRPRAGWERGWDSSS